MQKIFKSLIPSLIFVSIFLMLIMPVFVLAEDPSSASPDTGLIPCTNNCDFDAFMALVYNVIKFVLYKMVVPIAAVMFAYAGFLLITAGGEAAHARGKAKQIFTNTVIGLIFAVAAFLIIKTLLSIFGYNDIGMFFG